MTGGLEVWPTPPFDIDDEGVEMRADAAFLGDDAEMSDGSSESRSSSNTGSKFQELLSGLAAAYARLQAENYALQSRGRKRGPKAGLDRPSVPRDSSPQSQPPVGAAKARSSKWRTADAEVLPVWLLPSDGGQRSNQRGSDQVSRTISTGVIAGETLLAEHCLQHAVMHPNSSPRLAWDLCSIVVLAFDIFWVPMEFLHPPQSDAIEVLEWIVTLFWTGDLMVSFLTGFHSGALIEMRLGKIARRYMKGWLSFDVILLATDYGQRLMELESLDGGVNLIRIGKTVRLLRLLRTLRLLRLVKLHRILGVVLQHVKSDHLRAMMDIAGLVICMIIACHNIACGWYFVGDQGGDSGWPVRLVDPSSSTWYNYATALQWAVAQFNLQGPDYAVTMAERWYSICVMLAALIFFSSFVSNLTKAMTELWKLKTEVHKNNVALRQFFCDRKISVDLANEITSYLTHSHYAKRKRVHQSDISVLQVLPEHIQVRLSVETYQPHTVTHAFFSMLQEQDWTAISGICHHAMSEKLENPNQIVLMQGEVAERMLLVFSGSISYRHKSGTMWKVTSGEWLCEACMWMEWWHCGTATTTNTCELVLIDMKRLRELVVRRPEPTMRGFRRYATSFVSKVRALGEDASDLSFDVATLTGFSTEAFEESEVGSSVRSEGSSDSWDTRSQGANLNWGGGFKRASQIVRGLFVPAGGRASSAKF